MLAVGGAGWGAATSGVVRTARCNASLNGVSYSCDADGSPAVRGCGWYVDIDHADGIVTRYCHMIQRPDVTAGQTVTAGRAIGLSGVVLSGEPGIGRSALLDAAAAEATAAAWRPPTAAPRPPG